MAEKATDDYRKADADINLSRAEVEKVCIISHSDACVFKSAIRLGLDIRWIEKISFSWTL